MPRTEDGTPLTELLGELVAMAAATPGRPVGRKLPGGLHVAALNRPTHLVLTAWRTANRLPSARECEVLARDTGMLLPKISTFERQDGVLAFSVVDRASSPDQCDHRLGSPLHGDGRNESFWSWTCLTCGMTTTRLQARRGSRTRFEYGDQEVTETAWTILTVRGPRPWKELRQVRADLTASLTAGAGARQESSGPAEPRPAAPARAARAASTPVDSAARAFRDEAERQRHIRVLTLCALVQGCRSAWFRRAEAQDARLGFLRGATLAELREERRSRYGCLQVRITLSVTLRLARWRLAFRALPGAPE